MSMATLAIAWVLANPAITAPIIGASRPEELADSFAAAEERPLPGDIKATLDDITHSWRAVDADRRKGPCRHHELAHVRPYRRAGYPILGTPMSAEVHEAVHLVEKLGEEPVRR